MFKNLSQRDKRTLKLGAAGIVIVLAYFLVISPWFADWRGAGSELKTRRDKLKTIIGDGDRVSEVKQAGLFSIVPVFEMPKGQKEQLRLFRGKVNEQLKKAGIKVTSLKLKPVRKNRAKKGAGYSTLALECRGKCKFDQILDLIAALQENPYFVGIEQLDLKINSKERKEMDLVLVVSSFVK